jgi:hypothetical protein
METPQCPVCGKIMVYNAKGLARNPKSPTFQCSDSGCKFQLKKGTKDEYEPSEYITGVWIELENKTAQRQVAPAKFEQEIKEDIKSQQIKEMHADKVDNIAKSVALNKAVDFASAVCSHYDRFSDYEILKAEVLKVADLFLSWLRKEVK